MLIDKPKVACVIGADWRDPSLALGMTRKSISRARMPMRRFGALNLGHDSACPSN
jgi:hypothetical protein